MSGEADTEGVIATNLRLRTRIAQRIVLALMRLLFRVEIEGLERFPASDGLLVVCNHLCWIDNFLLFVGLPMRRRLYFLGDARGTSDNWLKRNVIDLVGGVIRLDRYTAMGDRAAIRQVLAVLEAGSNLVVYPEGEMSEDEGRLLPLRPGIAFFARRTGAPTVVVGLGGTRWLWRGKTLRLRIGPTIPPPARGGDEAYMEQVRRALLATMPPADPLPAHRPWAWLTNII